jgi:hypothetical protein
MKVAIGSKDENTTLLQERERAATAFLAQIAAGSSGAQSSHPIATAPASTSEEGVVPSHRLRAAAKSKTDCSTGNRGLVFAREHSMMMRIDCHIDGPIGPSMWQSARKTKTQHSSKKGSTLPLHFSRIKRRRSSAPVSPQAMHCHRAVEIIPKGATGPFLQCSPAISQEPPADNSGVGRIATNPSSFGYHGMFCWPLSQA